MGQVYNLDPLTVEPTRVLALVHKEMLARGLTAEAMHRMLRLDATSLLQRIRGEHPNPPKKSYVFRLVQWLNSLEPNIADPGKAQAQTMVEEMLYPNGGGPTNTKEIAKELRAIRDELHAVGEILTKVIELGMAP